MLKAKQLPKWKRVIFLVQAVRLSKVTEEMKLFGLV